jgi:hypothetical protein
LKQFISVNIDSEGTTVVILVRWHCPHTWWYIMNIHVATKGKRHILKPPGKCIMCWVQRKLDGLLRCGTSVYKLREARKDASPDRESSSHDASSISKTANHYIPMLSELRMMQDKAITTHC